MYNYTVDRIYHSVTPVDVSEMAQIEFDIYIDDEYKGTVTKEFSFFKPSFDIDYLGWHVDGDIFEWDYEIISSTGEVMAMVSKELFNFTDTYVLNIKYPQSALHVLMLVLAIDAEKDSRN